MATLNNVQSKREANNIIRNKQKELKNAIRAQQCGCDHKNKNGACLESVHSTNEYVRNRNDLPATAVICTACHDIFDMYAYSEEEVNGSISMIKSMLNQIKTLANLKDDEYADVVSLLEMVDDKLDKVLAQYYLGMIKRLGNENKNRNREDRDTKGRIGLGGNAGPKSGSFR